MFDCSIGVTAVLEYIKLATMYVVQLKWQTFCLWAFISWIKSEDMQMKWLQHTQITL